MRRLWVGLFSFLGCIGTVIVLTDKRGRRSSPITGRETQPDADLPAWCHDDSPDLHSSMVWSAEKWVSHHHAKQLIALISAQWSCGVHPGFRSGPRG
jgi:hypothetical protein